MAKNQRRKLKSKLICSGFTKLLDGPFKWDIKSIDLFEGFPVLPFVSWTMNTDRLNSFCRNILDPWEQIVWIGNDDLIPLLEFFRTESLFVNQSQVFRFCPSSHQEYLLRIRQTCDPSRTVYVVLGRTLDEFDLIKLVMALNREKKVFVGPAIGVMSEYARFLMIPFYPIETNSYRFWLHSELFYLPLNAMELSIENLIQGCDEGFSTLADLASATAHMVYNMQLKGIQSIYFIADSYPVFSLLKALRPLIEESGNGSSNCLKTKILTIESLKENYLEQVLSSDKRDLFFILNQTASGHRLETPITLPDILRENSYLGKELSVLDNQSFSRYNQANIDALQYQIKKNGSSFINLQYPESDLFSLGLITAFFYYFSCFSSWLRGYDVLNDPPYAEFDRLIWRFLKQPVE